MQAGTRGLEGVPEDSSAMMPPAGGLSQPGVAR